MSGFSTNQVDEYTDKFQRIIDRTNSIQIESIADGSDVERCISLVSDAYPEPIRSVECCIETASVGGTHVRYFEDWNGSTWTCRWGRHKNSHNQREHFHYPPHGDESDRTEVVDATYPQGMLLLETVCKFIKDRYLDLISSESLVFPREYEWKDEYGPDVYEL